MKKLLWWAIPLISMFGCTPVVFEQPQPQGVANARFPAEWKGTYLMDKDTIWISDKYFIGTDRDQGSLDESASGEYEGYILKDGVITDNTVTPPRTGTYTIEDGAVQYTFVSHPKSVLGDSLIFRQFEGRNLLNLIQDNGHWMVIRIEKQKSGEIMLYLTDAKEEIDALKKQMKVEEVLNDDGETDYFLANPSSKELKKFLDAGGFMQEIGALTPVKPQ